MSEFDQVLVKIANWLDFTNITPQSTPVQIAGLARGLKR